MRWRSVYSLFVCFFSSLDLRPIRIHFHAKRKEREKITLNFRLKSFVNLKLCLRFQLLLFSSCSLCRFWLIFRSPFVTVSFLIICALNASKHRAYFNGNKTPRRDLLLRFSLFLFFCFVFAFCIWRFDNNLKRLNKSMLGSTTRVGYGKSSTIIICGRNTIRIYYSRLVYE